MAKPTSSLDSEEFGEAKTDFGAGAADAKTIDDGFSSSPTKPEVGHASMFSSPGKGGG